MFYQPIVLSDEMFSVHALGFGEFPLHWHSDLEILFCHEGSFDVVIDGEPYHVTAGQAVFIGSSLLHEYLSIPVSCRATILRVGSVFFGSDCFSEIAKRQFETHVLTDNKEINAVFSRVAFLHKQKKTLENMLELQGLVFSLVSLFLRHLPPARTVSTKHKKRLNYILNIQKALDFVSENFDKEISVRAAAEVVGYEKNAFSRVFKQATDTTFHKYLSQYRIKKACILLSEESAPIAEIAEKVGIPEYKTFCRVFKQVMGVTPGVYRKQKELQES